MSTNLIVRPAVAADVEAWLALWRGYCAALDGVVSDEVTVGVWQRILAPDEPIGCLLACRYGDEPVGFANYVLHPHTWGLQPVCYLEDRFVAPEARGSGVGRALIERLVALGKQHGWRRVYWHTHDNNYRARTLYDRLTPENRLRPLRHRPVMWSLLFDVVMTSRGSVPNHSTRTISAPLSSQA